MDLDPKGREVAHQGAGAVSSNNVAMATHEPNISTFCATRKHKMSFDPVLAAWQLPRMSIGKRIAEARKSRGVSQSGLGDGVGAAQTTVSSWERGRTEPTREDVQRIADFLKISPAELELDNASVTERRTVPLVGYVGAGAAAHYYASADEGLGEADAPEDATESTVAVEIRGTSLGPLFESWLVYYDDVRSPVTPDLYGKLCVVGLPDGRVLVKKIRPARTPGLFHLESNTEPTMPDEQIVWAAKVKTLKPR